MCYSNIAASPFPHHRSSTSDPLCMSGSSVCPFPSRVSPTPVLAHLLHVRLCPKAMYPLSLGAVQPQVDGSALSSASWDHPSPFLPSKVAPTESLQLPNIAGAWWVSHQRSHRSGFPSDLRSTRQVLLTLSEPQQGLIPTLQVGKLRMPSISSLRIKGHFSLTSQNAKSNI